MTNVLNRSTQKIQFSTQLRIISTAVYTETSNIFYTYTDDIQSLSNRLMMGQASGISLSGVDVWVCPNLETKYRP